MWINASHYYFITRCNLMHRVFLFINVFNLIKFIIFVEI